MIAILLKRSRVNCYVLIYRYFLKTDLILGAFCVLVIVYTGCKEHAPGFITLQISYPH